ncbi:pyrroline-5-carboxylate reductase [Paenibacillus xerothermodurans]|uniref:Pyrroline-5-carboxylate reductase n=1 Tax=Paenibacillus xerothermodurans TaxID=1977292 RepID=A0A2W1P6C9_PAEXE|nr:pyrroline-5-carboxylate reductase [Paenibacillus xerothermodurans]PZE22618.1 pyrroline-5-carboxylate reductase [Paenibacillus xerothermodurans]
MPLSLSNAMITFVGAGSMAEAIIRGLTSQGQGDPARITVLNRQDRSRLNALQQTYGVSYAVEPADKDGAIAQADVVVAAFKPKDAIEGITALRPLLRRSQLLISVIAGLSTSTIQSILHTTDQPIVRTMPNTSSSIGLGATGLSFTAAVSEEQRQLAVDMFSSAGIVTVVEEAQLDIVTGVSGSGPAYIYYMMEAMIEGGIRGGLSPEAAKQLTVQTVLGAAKMVELTGEEPSQLRRKVTSPNGTTQAALETLQSHDFSAAVTKAVLRAAERAGELGQAISTQASSQK